jgi:hypothetical protein
MNNSAIEAKGVIPRSPVRLDRLLALHVRMKRVASSNQPVCWRLKTSLFKWLGPPSCRANQKNASIAATS